MHFSIVVNTFTSRLKFYPCILLCGALIAGPRVAGAALPSPIFIPTSFTSLGSNPFTNSGTCTIDTSGSGPVLTLPDSSTITGVVVLGSIAVFTFDSISIPSNVTVVGLRNAGSRPVALLSHGDVTIDGIVNVSGANGQSQAAPSGNTGGAGGAAGPGGGGGGGGGGGFNSGSGGIVRPTGVIQQGLGEPFLGGVGGAGFVNGTSGNPGGPTDGGIGGAGGAVEPNGSGTGGIVDSAGGGGAFGGNGGNANITLGAGGTAYGDLSTLLEGGSGGGGGGGIGGTAGDGGAGGGGGGGAVEIGAVNQITVTGSVLANGGSGGSELRNGGGGAGGGILINGDAVSFWGASALSAAGGAGPIFSGGGGGGRIGILAATAITTEGTDLTSRVNLAGGSASDGGHPGSNGVLVTSGTICPTLRVVLNTNDNGPGSLRQAILDANDCPATNTITFAPSAYGTITLTSGELEVTSDLIIDGPGATNVSVNGNYPNTTNRVFHIDPGLYVTIFGLTITNGVNISGGGGGIINDHSMLTISNCTISGNSSYGSAGGIMNDGESSGSATLVIVNSTLGGNSAYNAGGGILNEGEVGSATLVIVNSTLSGNSAYSGGGLYNDAEDHGNNLVRIFNSTVSSNFANTGGGIYNDGELGSATLVIVNSTLSGNSATNGPGGGGIFNLGQSGNAMLEILNSTLSGNSATNGPGGIYLQGLSGSAPLDIASTILDATGASGGTIGSDSGTVNSWGHNLSSDGGDGFLTNTGDQTNTNPMLGPLQDNGGPTFTHALLCGSPAIDKGTNFSGSATDQRGLSRTFDDPSVPNAVGGDGTDIGAVELQTVCNHPPVAICTNVTVSASANCTATASVDGGSYDPDYGDSISLVQSPSGPYPVGTNTVTLTVTDSHNASNSCIAQLIVRDVSPPTIACPSDLVLGTDPSQCGAVVVFKVLANDNCGTVNTVCSPSSGTFFPQGTTKVTCTATDGSGNTTNCSFNVTVGQSNVCAITVSGNSGNSTTICQGQTVILTAPNGMKHYLWSGPEQNGAQVQTIVVGTAGTYYCTQQQYYGSTNCCSVTITVNPPPGCPISGNLVITNGQPTTLVGPAGMASQYWTGPQNNGLASRSNTVITAGTYTLHITDSNGCQNTGSVTVQNRTPAPCSITVSGDAGGLTICQGLTSILTGANGMTSYLWSGPEQNGATAKSIRVGTQGTYTVQQIDGAGLTNSCSVFLTVHPLPGINIFGARTFCQGTNTTLYGPDGMKNYLWLGPQHNGFTTQSNTISIAGTYTLQITDSNGCQNALAVPVSAIVCP